MNRHGSERQDDDLQWAPALDAASALMSVHDAHYRIVKANAPFVMHFQRAPEEIIGQKCHELIHGTPRPPAHCPYARALKTGSHKRVQFVEPSVGRRRLGSCSPIFGSDGKLVGAIHIAMDVRTPAPPDVMVTKDLSRQQKQILKLLCCGRTAKGIAAQLGISPRTVEYHKHRMMQKLSVHSLAELISHVLTQNPAPIK